MGIGLRGDCLRTHSPTAAAAAAPVWPQAVIDEAANYTSRGWRFAYTSYPRLNGGSCGCPAAITACGPCYLRPISGIARCLPVCASRY